MLEVEFYYFSSLFIGFLYFIHYRVGYFALLFLLPLLLFFLKSTGLDYEAYKFDYESGYSLSNFPFFYTNGGLTAEPLYKIYSGFIRVISGVDFNFFLVINFLLCYFLFCFFSPFTKLKKNNINSLFWYFMIPVIFPTVFYFSPRSSISFFLIFIGFILMVEGRNKLYFLFLALGVSVHSQFIPVAVFLIFVNFSLKNLIQQQSYKVYWYLFIYTVLLTIFLLVAPKLTSILSSLLAFLPSGDVASNKIHYMNSAKSGFRITSILSLIVFPSLAFILFRSSKTERSLFGLSSTYQWKLIFFLCVIVAYGFSVNLAFFNTPHLSGRLGRFSDYTSFSLLLPLALKARFSNKTVIFVGYILVISAPFIYPTIYSVHN